MSRPPLFLIDTSVLIQAHRQYYPFDICPGFWRGIVVHHKARRLASIDRIKGEIVSGADDDLKQWTSDTIPAEFFKGTADQRVIDKFAEMMAWVTGHGQYSDAAKAEFASIADGWLAAYACCNKCVVVTQEIKNNACKIKVPIPNLCEKFSVEYASTYGMLRSLDVKMVLKKRNP
jgi:hypothetical protein